MTKEIEIRALLTKEKYEQLKSLLPQKFKQITEDKVTTIKFQPPDVRIRFSDNFQEIVYKSGNSTHDSRKEISVKLNSKEDCEKMIEILRNTGLKEEPQWFQHKQEFLYDNKYTLSLQHIKNFAYILEAEIIDEDETLHLPILKQILTNLGCEPIDKEQFKVKIEEYIKNNK
jgi:hypothetical protein